MLEGGCGLPPPRQNSSLSWCAGYRGPSMDQTHDKGHAGTPTRSPWRDRLVQRLGGTFPERGLTFDQLVRLIYPTLPEELRGAIDAAGAGDLTEVSTVRKMLGHD